MREGGRKQIGVVERKEDKEEREKGISLVIESVGRCVSVAMEMT